jgi:hypothetical protein
MPEYEARNIRKEWITQRDFQLHEVIDYIVDVFCSVPSNVCFRTQLRRCIYYERFAKQQQ